MQQLVKLVGIARLAAEGSTLAEKRKVEYRTLPTRNWLNRCHSQRVPFTWSVNPYRGCEYGCKYCYARFTHEFLERRDSDAFETEIYAKDWDSAAFTEELKAVKPGHVIGIGTATDPYQPAERKFKRTRRLLEALGDVRQTSIFVTTKSNLVSRDADLFKQLSEHNHVRITLTVTTMDRELARLTEPMAPRPDLRMKAVRELAHAGVRVGVIANPVLPLITDNVENLEAVARAAKEAGADHFSAGVLFLKPSSARVYMPFIAERFPQHLGRYRRSYASGAYLHGAYPERISALVQSIRERVGIGSRDLALEAPPPPVPVPDSQLLLF